MHNTGGHRYRFEFRNRTHVTPIRSQCAGPPKARVTRFVATGSLATGKHHDHALACPTVS